MNSVIYCYCTVQFLPLLIENIFVEMSVQTFLPCLLSVFEDNAFSFDKFAHVEHASIGRVSWRCHPGKIANA